MIDYFAIADSAFVLLPANNHIYLNNTKQVHIGCKTMLS